MHAAQGETSKIYRDRHVPSLVAPANATSSKRRRTNRLAAPRCCVRCLLFCALPAAALLTIVIFTLQLDEPTVADSGGKESATRRSEVVVAQSSNSAPLAEYTLERAAPTKTAAAKHPTAVAAHPAPPDVRTRVMELPDIMDNAEECAVASSEAHSLPTDVTLVTQASGERLWMLPHICMRWGGRMIVATLRPTDGSRTAWPDMSQSRASLDAASIAAYTVGCSLQRLELTPPDSMRVSNDGDAFPINWLRNGAIGCVVTSHYFVVDIDFWPSAELHLLLRGRLAEWTENAPLLALVVPNFQRSGHGCRNMADGSACRTSFDRGNISMASTLVELHECLRTQDCVIFDGEFNPQGQASTDVRAWRLMRAGDTRRVACITSDRYEPFVALRKSARTPPFDERFVGYGKNKVQMLVHLRNAGFAFEVLR